MYTQLNAEFQRDKKAVFNEQCIKKKKKSKKTEGERLQISSGKLEISREHLIQRWAQ